MLGGLCPAELASVMGSSKKPLLAAGAWKWLGITKKHHTKKRPDLKEETLLPSSVPEEKTLISSSVSEEEKNVHKRKPPPRREKDQKRNKAFPSAQKNQKRKPYLQTEHGSRHRDRKFATEKRKNHTEAAGHGQSSNTGLYPIRKKVDAETMQYFAEISSLLGTGSLIIDTEERATLIANALEETHGKELELACEKSCSRVLEMLVLSSDATQVASFLHRTSPFFPSISIDAAGSHVAEALLKSAAALLHDYDREATWFRTLNQALNLICQVVGERATDMMSNCYGSHVVRSLLSLLSGVTFEASDKRTGGHSGGLLGRLSHTQNRADIPKQDDIIFPQLLQPLVERLLEAARRNTLQLCRDPFAGPVLQAMLKILAGDASTVAKAIRILLGCNTEKINKQGNTLEDVSSENLKQLMFDNSSSHLVEVMLEVAPDALYMEMFQQILIHHILEYALHQSANFVVQALITSVRNRNQADLLFAELRPNFWTLIKEMRSGIITSILQACKRFHSNEQEVCRSLANAINLENASPSCLVPRLLFLESYARSNGSKDWNPDFGKKMSVLGCAMLQLIFSYPEECNQQFWLSLVSMESVDILVTIKDPGGCHVVESFLSSGAPWKHKNRLMSKLKGHFAELASHMLSSFTLEKCFSVAKIDLKEAIASELASVQTELAKTKHGPHLIKKFDIMGYSRMPDQWRMRIISKQGTLKAYADVFNLGSSFERNGQIDASNTQSLDYTRSGHKGKWKGAGLELKLESTMQGKKKKGML